MWDALLSAHADFGPANLALFRLVTYTPLEHFPIRSNVVNVDDGCDDRKYS